MFQLKEIVNVNAYQAAYGFRKNSPYEKFISKEILRLHHLIISKKKEFRLSLDRNTCENGEDENKLSSLSLMKLVSLFIILTFGGMGSLIVLALEKIFKQCLGINEKDHKNSKVDGEDGNATVATLVLKIKP